MRHFQERPGEVTAAVQGQGETSFGVFCVVPESILEELELFATGASGMMRR